MSPRPIGASPVFLADSVGHAVNVDPFGRLDVANPFTLDEFINLYEVDSRRWATSLVGGGLATHIPAHSAIRVSVTAANGDSAILRSQRYFAYQAGKAQHVLITAYHADTGQTNQVREWGYYDENNGLFFRLSGTTLSVVQRSNTSGVVVDTVVNQSAWNVDKMSGSGPSGIALDITKGNVYGFTFQWLGAGVATAYISNVAVHTFENPNTYAAPFMRTAQLPVSIRVANTGASTGSSLTFICGTVYSGAGRQTDGESFGVYNAADIVVSTTEIPLVAIRPAATYNSIASRMHFIPTFLTGSNDGGRAAIRIVLNPATVTGGAGWVSASARSGIEVNLTATAFTGGQHLVRYFLPNAVDRIIESVREIFEGPSNQLHAYAFSGGDVLLVTGVKEAAGNTNMRTSLTWEELR